jgi:hypothetical protein
MSGYRDLPAGTNVVYKLGFNGREIKVLIPSETAFSDEVSLTVPPTLGQWAIPYISIVVSGPLGQALPGVYVDGAHVFVKRAEDPAQYATWNVPVIPDKGVKTVLDRPGWTSSPFDIYTLARNCDGIILGEDDGAFAARLKYLNPHIKTYSLKKSSPTGKSRYE